MLLLYTKGTKRHEKDVFIILTILNTQRRRKKGIRGDLKILHCQCSWLRRIIISETATTIDVYTYKHLFIIISDCISILFFKEVPRCWVPACQPITPPTRTLTDVRRPALFLWVPASKHEQIKKKPALRLLLQLLLVFEMALSTPRKRSLFFITILFFKNSQSEREKKRFIVEF